MSGPVVLVMAKVPIPGHVKTRLAATEGPVRAAQLATAALLDTLDVCELTFGVSRCHVSLAGDLARLDDGELRWRLGAWTVHPQCGDGLGERIANAHRELHPTALAPVVQIGIDTPHVTSSVLRLIAAKAVHQPVLGLAEDGGWWVLATNHPAQVDGLEKVLMSTATTGQRTGELLRTGGSIVGMAPSMRDVDDAADAEHVATLAPTTRFAQVWRANHDLPPPSSSRG